MAKYFPFVDVSLNQVKSNQVYGDLIDRYKQSNTEKTVVKNKFLQMIAENWNHYYSGEAAGVKIR